MNGMNSVKGHSTKDQENEENPPGTSRQNTLAPGATSRLGSQLQSQKSRTGLRVAINDKPFVHPHMQSRNTGPRRLGGRGNLHGRGISPDSRHKGSIDQTAAKE